jgi:hypothetical protein
MQPCADVDVDAKKTCHQLAREARARLKSCGIHLESTTALRKLNCQELASVLGQSDDAAFTAALKEVLVTRVIRRATILPETQVPEPCQVSKRDIGWLCRTLILNRGHFAARVDNLHPTWDQGAYARYGTRGPW